jgi:hypothetical protein
MWAFIDGGCWMYDKVSLFTDIIPQEETHYAPIHPLRLLSFGKALPLPMSQGIPENNFFLVMTTQWMEIFGDDPPTRLKFLVMTVQLMKFFGDDPPPHSIEIFR